MSESVRKYPEWRPELYFDERNLSVRLSIKCKRPCCGDDACDQIRHRIGLSCPAVSGGRNGRVVSLSIEGTSEELNEDQQPRYIYLPSGYTTDDLMAGVREQLDLVPVCIRMLEADNIHWLERSDIRDFG